MELLGDVGHVEAPFGTFGDSANLDARYEHGLRRTYRGSKIILDAPNGTPRCRGSCGISFKSVWRQVCVRAR
jgi:hypothetical protein